MKNGYIYERNAIEPEIGGSRVINSVIEVSGID